jgi:hypothetical protein
MRCERLLLFLLLIVACSQERPAPPMPAAPPSSQPPAAAPPAQTALPVEPVPVVERTYDEALNWFRSAKGFTFVLDDGDVHAEGRMARKTVGAELVEFRANGAEWRASSGALGVTWERRSGGKWTKADAPQFGNRVYQRVTIGVDPQKQEGAAQLAGTEGRSNHYRFTNANTGQVHELWVAQGDKHLERMKIGDLVDLKIKP